MSEEINSEIPEIRLKGGKLGKSEFMYNDVFWFRLQDDDGYTLFEVSIPLISPLNEVQKELVLRLVIAKFKLCETIK